MYSLAELSRTQVMHNEGRMTAPLLSSEPSDALAWLWAEFTVPCSVSSVHELSLGEPSVPGYTLPSSHPSVSQAGQVGLKSGGGHSQGLLLGGAYPWVREVHGFGPSPDVSRDPWAPAKDTAWHFPETFLSPQHVKDGPPLLMTN